MSRLGVIQALSNARILRWTLVALCLALMGSPPAFAGSAVGSFEIDGNLVDSPAGEPIDWSTPPPNLTSFTDAVKRNDDVFKEGSKQLEPANWTCVKGSAPPKDDIRAGQISFRRFPAGTGDQFIYVNFTRVATNGSADIDYEFNQSSIPNSACPLVSQRTEGDIVLAFDAFNGGASITVRAFRWVGTATLGTLEELALGTQGDKWDGAVNIPNTIPNHVAGDFGEAALNLTKTIGTITCNRFAGVYMKSRSSVEINSALKDRTTVKPLNIGECPSSRLAKAVRNVTASQAFTADGPTSTSAQPGDTIEYRLSYTNTGAGAATNVVVSDTIQSKQTLVPGSCVGTSTPPCSATGSTLTWNVGTVNPGATVTMTFRVVLDGIGSFPAGTSTPVKNAAVARNNEEPQKPSNETTTTVQSPDSSLAKAVRVLPATTFATTANAKPGDTLEYRLTYTNAGPGRANDVVVRDTIAAKQTLVPSSCVTTSTPPCTVSGSTLTWNVGTVNSGQSVVMTFKVVLDSTFPAGSTPVKNSAVVDTREEPEEPSNETTTTVTSNPNSSLDKAARNCTPTCGSFGTTISAKPGDTIEYRLTYRNSGTSAASGVVITDTIQAKQTLVPGSCVDTSIPPCSASGSTLAWTVGTVNPGQTVVVTFRVILDSSFPAGTTPVKNVGTVDTAEEAPKNSNETTVNVSAAPASGLGKAVRNVTTSGSFATTATASPGDTLEYRLTYSNTGDAPASGVVVTDTIQAKQTLVSGSCVGTSTPPCSASGSTLTWNLGTVNPGQTVVMTFQVRLDSSFPAGATAVKNVGVVDTAEEPPKNSNETTVTVNAAPRSELAKAVRNATAGEAFTADGPTSTSAKPGDLIEYRLTYTNAGDAPASNVAVSDTIQAGQTFVSCSQTPPCSASGSMVSWSLGTVNPGQTVVMTFQVELDSSFPAGTTTVKNVGVVDTAQEPPKNSNETTVTVSAAPKLSLVKSTPATVVTPGDLITYTLAYKNEGNAPAANVRIDEAIPAGTEFVSCGNGCTTNGSPVSTASWAIGTVPAGGFGSVTMTVRVLSSVGCQICNTAKISSQDQGSGAPIDSNPVCVGSIPGPSFDGANASGIASGAHVEVGLLGINETLPKPPGTNPSVSSSRSTIGGDSETASQLTAAVPPPAGGVLQADVLRTTSTSRVTEQPAQADDTSVAETLGVNILNGVVTADVVRAVATATASGDASSFSSAGSTFENLRINGQAINDVKPGQVVDLPDDVFGPGSQVTLLDVKGSTSQPPVDTLKGGTYKANVDVTMIQVHATTLATGVVDVMVSRAGAAATFAQTELCADQAKQSVSGHAFIASTATNPHVLPTLAGFVSIPATGGHESKAVNSLSLPADGSVVTSGAAETDTQGTRDADSSDASSYAQAKRLCVLKNTAGVCAVKATLVRSQANSTAGGGAASSTDLGTSFVGLQIQGGPATDVTPLPNTTITLPGVGFVILNEQVCDGSVPLPCAGTEHSGRTVRAVHVVATFAAPPLLAGAEVIVAEAHSDATFVPAP